MGDAFDPYYQWLSIPPENQPPNHYQLLGVTPFESGEQVISNAADMRLTHIRTFQAGKHAVEAAKLCNEISAARLCLLDPEKRAAYDAELKETVEEPEPPPLKPLPQATPIDEPSSDLPPVEAAEEPKPGVRELVTGKIIPPMAAAFHAIRTKLSGNKPTGDEPADEPGGGGPASDEPPSDQPATERPMITIGKFSLPRTWAIIIAGVGCIVLAICLRSAYYFFRGEEQGAWGKGRPSEAATELPRGAILYMSFEPDTIETQHSRVTIEDLSGSDNDGVCTNLAPQRDGAVGWCVPCDPAGISLPQALLNKRSDYTIAAWIKFDGMKYMYLYEEPDKSFPFCRLEPMHQGYFFVNVRNQERGRATTRARYDFPPPAKGAWKFVAARMRNGSADKGELTVFVDGNRDTQDVHISSSDVTHSLVGKGGGWIDELMVFDRALSDKEIESLSHRKKAFEKITPRPAVDRGSPAASLVDRGPPSRPPAVDRSSPEPANELEPIPCAEIEVASHVVIGRPFATGAFCGGGTNRCKTVRFPSSLKDLPYTRWLSSAKGKVALWARSPGACYAILLAQNPDELLPNLGGSFRPTSAYCVMDPDNRAFEGEWKCRVYRADLKAGDEVTVDFPADDRSIILLAKGFDREKRSSLTVYAPFEYERFSHGAPITKTNTSHFARSATSAGLYMPFTCWKEEEIEGVKFKVDKEGACYAILRASDAGEAATCLRKAGFAKTSLPCEITVNKELVPCAVYRACFPEDINVALDLPRRMWMVLGASYLRSERPPSPARPADPIAGRLPPDGQLLDPPGQPSAPVPPVAAVPLVTTAKTDARHPIPSPADQAQALRKVDEALEVEKRKQEATDYSKRVKLTWSLRSDSRLVEGNPTQQYVLLREACLVAAEAGDLTTAIGVVKEIEGKFKADGTAMQLALADKALKAKLPLPLKGRTVQAAISVVDEAMADNQYEGADKLARSLLSYARQLRGQNFTQKLTDRRKQIQEKLKSFRKIDSARRTLQTNPADPAANFTIGLHLCVDKGKWNEGIPLLAKCGNPKLREAAARDAAAPTDAIARLGVGDGWYDLAQSQQEDAKKAMLLRAQDWYRRSHYNLSGLGRAKVDKRLEELGKTLETDDRLTVNTKAWIHAAASGGFELYRSGRRYCTGDPATPVRTQAVFEGGDTIIVRARRSGDDYAFACAFDLQWSELQLATGRDNRWMSYRPASLTEWYRVGADAGTIIGPAILGSDKNHLAQKVSTESKMPCRGIWGTYSDQPTDAGGYTYLILQIW